MLKSGDPNLGDAKNELIYEYIMNVEFENITQSLVSSLNECSSAAKVPRLKCLNALMAYVSKPEHKALLRRILPEVILSMREVNQKSRDASVDVLNTMLRLWQKIGAEANPSLNEAGMRTVLYCFLNLST